MEWGRGVICLFSIIPQTSPIVVWGFPELVGAGDDKMTSDCAASHVASLNKIVSHILNPPRQLILTFHSLFK